MPLQPHVDGVDPVVELGREVDPVVVVPDPLRARKNCGLLHLLTGREILCGRVGHRPPRHRSVARHGRRLEETLGQVRVGGRGVSVQHALGLVLGEIERLADRIHGHRLVSEVSHRRMRDGGGGAGRITLPDQPIADVGLLTRQPGPPWGWTARAIRVAALKDRVRVEHVALRREVNGAGTAAGGRHEVEDLAIADVVPAAVAVIKGRSPVREQAPAVLRPGHRLPRHGDNARGEPVGDDDAIRVGREPVDRAVRRLTRQRGLGRGHSHRRKQGGAGGAGHSYA